MIYTVQENKLTLYYVKLRKNYLKALKKIMISKYGNLDTHIKSLNREDFHMYSHMYADEMTPVVTKKNYNRNNQLIEIHFFEVKNPPLANAVIHLLQEPDEYYSILSPFVEDFCQLLTYEEMIRIQEDLSISENPKKYEQIQFLLSDVLENSGFERGMLTPNDSYEDVYSLCKNVLNQMHVSFPKKEPQTLEFLKKYKGLEYLPAILHSIRFIPVFQEKLENPILFCEELKESGFEIHKQVDPVQLDFASKIVKVKK